MSSLCIRNKDLAKTHSRKLADILLSVVVNHFVPAGSRNTIMMLKEAHMATCLNQQSKFCAIRWWQPTFTSCQTVQYFRRSETQYRTFAEEKRKATQTLILAHFSDVQRTVRMQKQSLLTRAQWASALSSHFHSPFYHLAYCYLPQATWRFPLIQRMIPFFLLFPDL